VQFTVTQIYITLRFCAVTRLPVRRKGSTYWNVTFSQTAIPSWPNNRYQDIKRISRHKDFCIGWPRIRWSVSTSQPAPLLLRESCWVVAGIAQFL